MKLTELKDDNTNKTFHYYDGANRRTKTVDALGETTGNYILFTYDDNGNLTKTEEKEYNQKTSTMETFRTDFTYDALDRGTKMAVDPALVEVRNLDESGVAYSDEWIVSQESVINIMNRPTSSKREVSSAVYVTTTYAYGLPRQPAQEA